MSLNRAQRRAVKHKASEMAAKLAATCYDFNSQAIVRVTNPEAIAALTRAFTLMLRGGGRSVAVPISRAEARAFPRHDAEVPPDFYPWLAVGLDAGFQASYSLQIVGGYDKALANEAARLRALAELDRICATSSLPMGPPAGRA